MNVNAIIHDLDGTLFNSSRQISVDAHSQDGLENALSTISEFASGKIITVFGCGGDRDRTKRPIMGHIAAQYSDSIFVTSDNPSTEDPECILQDIKDGIVKADFDQYELVVDRKTAIQKLSKWLPQMT